MDVSIDIRYAYLGILAIMAAVLIAFVCSVLFISKRIGMWKLFERAGEKEWKSIVPVYNQITLLKICKLKPTFILLYLDFLVPLVGYFVGRDVKWMAIVMLVGYMIYRFMIAIRVGQSFKKGDVFSFFLAFFPAILLPVLSCSKDQTYIGIVESKAKK